MLAGALLGNPKASGPYGFHSPPMNSVRYVVDRSAAASGAQDAVELNEVTDIPELGVFPGPLYTDELDEIFDGLELLIEASAAFVKVKAALRVKTVDGCITSTQLLC
jgi:hypothetical protein